LDLRIPQRHPRTGQRSPDRYQPPALAEAGKAPPFYRNKQGHLKLSRGAFAKSEIEKNKAGAKTERIDPPRRRTSKSPDVMILEQAKDIQKERRSTQRDAVKRQDHVNHVHYLSDRLLNIYEDMLKHNISLDDLNCKSSLVQEYKDKEKQRISADFKPGVLPIAEFGGMDLHTS